MVSRRELGQRGKRVADDLISYASHMHRHAINTLCDQVSPSCLPEEYLFRCHQLNVDEAVVPQVGFCGAVP
jgi:hypothetical protein